MLCVCVCDFFVFLCLCVCLSLALLVERSVRHQSTRSKLVHTISLGLLLACTLIIATLIVMPQHCHQSVDQPLVAACDHHPHLLQTFDAK